MGACAELRAALPPEALFPLLWARVADWCAGRPDLLVGVDEGLLPAKAEVLEVEPPRLLRYRLAGERFEVEGSYRLEPLGEGTLLRHAVEARALYQVAQLLEWPAEASAAAQGLAGLEPLAAAGASVAGAQPGPAKS